MLYSFGPRITSNGTYLRDIRWEESLLRREGWWTTNLREVRRKKNMHTQGGGIRWTSPFFLEAADFLWFVLDTIWLGIQRYVLPAVQGHGRITIVSSGSKRESDNQCTVNCDFALVPWCYPCAYMALPKYASTYGAVVVRIMHPTTKPNCCYSQCKMR